MNRIVLRRLSRMALGGVEWRASIPSCSLTSFNSSNKRSSRWLNVDTMEQRRMLSSGTEAEVGSTKHLEGLVASDKVVVFMKGTADAPQCGFSNAVCQIMKFHGVPFSSVDVLSDERIREGVKKYSDWPTIPQVYIGGEFVGGCDIMIQLHQDGELDAELAKVGLKSLAPKSEEKEKGKDGE